MRYWKYLNYVVSITRVRTVRRTKDDEIEKERIREIEKERAPTFTIRDYLFIINIGLRARESSSSLANATRSRTSRHCFESEKIGRLPRISSVVHGGGGGIVHLT